MADVIKLTRADFKEEGKSQWVAHRGGYRLLIRRIDGSVEISIRAELLGDPNEEDFDKALKTFNHFLRQLRVGEKQE